MLFRQKTHADRLSELLADLPPHYRWVDLGAERLIVGPTGAFLVAEGHRNARVAAQRVATVAVRFRDLLAAKLSLAPFVDALVVADEEPGTEVRAASVVPSRMVLDTLLCGPTLLDDETVEQVVRAAREIVPKLPENPSSLAL